MKQVKDICPECLQELEQVVEKETNTVIGVYCENCKHQEKY